MGYRTQAGEQIAAAGEAKPESLAGGGSVDGDHSGRTSPAAAPDEGDPVTDETEPPACPRIVMNVERAGFWCEATGEFARFATHCGSGRPHSRAVQQTIVRVIPEVE